MCMGGSPKTPEAPPAPPPAPPPPAPTVLQTADEGGSKTSSTNKGRKSLRIDLTSQNVGGPSGLNLPM